jgi:hypothetical protein
MNRSTQRKHRLITEIGEDELYDMGVMVYTLKMMKAGKDPSRYSRRTELTRC